MPVPEVAVRRAAAADLTVLTHLMRAFYAEADFPLDLGWAEAAFGRLFADAKLGCAWIAERDGVPVGHAVLTVRYTMEHGALSGSVDDLYVLPAFRRLGVARALLEELVRECELRSCRALNVEVGRDNVAALALYREFGLREFQDGRTLLSGEIRSGGT